MNLTVSTKLPDASEYYRLYETTGWNDEYHLTCDELFHSLQNSYYSVSIYDEDDLVGFGRVVSDGVLHAMIYEMIVHPDYQGKRIGNMIIHLLLDKCREDNIRDIQLFCAKGKQGFYEKHGFRPRETDAPGMDLVK